MTPATPATWTGPDGAEPYDLIGVGLGPFNLSLAALADGVPGLRAVFFEQNPVFRWHPGLLLEGTSLQVPFLADLVTLIDPTSRWSFLSYLREHDRLFRFYFYERFHIPRREYDDYCRWVAGGLPSTRFGMRVEAVRWDGGSGLFHVTVRPAAPAGPAGPGGPGTALSDGPAAAAAVLTARHIVLGVGTEPAVPAAFTGLLGDRVFHSAHYLDHRDRLRGARHVTVVGSGQSGAEVFADLLRAQPETGHALTWLTRTPAFAPMEYSKLGLEQFTPDFVRYFHGLDQARKDELVPTQWQLYKAISADTIAEIYDLLYERTVGGAEVDARLLPNVAVEDVTVEDAAVKNGALKDEAVEGATAQGGGPPGGGGRILLRCRHRDQGRRFTVETDAVVLATGYAPRQPRFLDPMADLLDLDAAGRFRVDARYRVATAPEVTGRVYVQNAELHTHGVGAPDLGLGAWRAAVILDDLTGGAAHPLPRPSAFTTFGVPEAGGFIRPLPDGDGSGGQRAGGPGEGGPDGTASDSTASDSGASSQVMQGARPEEPAAVGGAGR